jgi:hypothetical protein
MVFLQVMGTILINLFSYRSTITYMLLTWLGESVRLCNLATSCSVGLKLPTMTIGVWMGPELGFNHTRECIRTEFIHYWQGHNTYQLISHLIWISLASDAIAWPQWEFNVKRGQIHSGWALWSPASWFISSSRFIMLLNKLDWSDNYMKMYRDHVKGN